MQRSLLSSHDLLSRTYSGHKEEIKGNARKRSHPVYICTLIPPELYNADIRCVCEVTIDFPGACTTKCPQISPTISRMLLQNQLTTMKAVQDG